MSDEIAVVAIVEAKPGREQDVAAAIHACVATTRKEVGCLGYAAHTDVESPARFVFIERWKSRAALATHEKEPHFLKMAEAFKSLLQGPLQVLVLRDL